MSFVYKYTVYTSIANILPCLLIHYELTRNSLNSFEEFSYFYHISRSCQYKRFYLTLTELTFFLINLQKTHKLFHLTSFHLLCKIYYNANFCYTLTSIATCGSLSSKYCSYICKNNLHRTILQKIIQNVKTM